MSASEPLPRVWRTVRWPLLISLIVVVARLVGELMHGDPRFFSTAAGGNVAIVGVGWLMPIFGVVFGWILTGRGHAPDRPGLSIILHLLGMTVLAGGMFLVTNNLDYPVALGALAGVAVVALIFAWRGWPELLRFTLAYGVLVRLTVVAVTALALAFHWDTHFVNLPPNPAYEPLGTLDRFALLAGSQLLLWVPSTVLIGGVFGSIAVLIRGRRSDDAPDE